MIGENGSGKTTLFELLNKLKEFIVGGKRVEEVFKAHTLTRWQNVALQKFELTFEEDDELYVYKCSIEHNLDKRVVRLFSESLEHNQQPLFRFSIDNSTSHARLYNDLYREGPELPFGWTQSGVGYIEARPDNKKLTRFKELLAHCLFIQIVPSKISSVSDKEDEYPDYQVSNYVNWYRFLSQDVGQLINLTQALREVLHDFDNFKLENSGDSKILQLRFKGVSGSYTCRFDELSEGQKSLCILYTLIYCLSKSYTLCIDEPENFLALKEINPWLNNCYDEWQGQLLIISHNPVIINNFDAKKSTWFSRQEGFHTRVQEITEEQSVPGGISVAELVERGWLFDE